MSDQAMPADVDAERATLGCVLLDRESIIRLSTLLPDPAALSVPAHQAIYRAMLACYKARTPPDIVTVAGKLARQKATARQHANRLEEIGGTAYLVELSNSVPTAYHLDYYARQVAQAAVLRDVINAGAEIAKLGMAGGDIEEIKAKIDRRLQSLAGAGSEGELVPLAQVISEIDAMIEAARNREMVGLPTGYRDLDELLGGLQKSDLILLAARPAVGKSSLGLCIAHNVALQQRRPVAFFALEMARIQLGQRLLAMQTGVDVQKLRTGTIRGDDINRLVEAMGILSDLPLHIDHSAAVTLAYIRGRCIRMQAEHGLELVIIDYLQLMRGAGENRVQEVSEISRGLKALARELDVPVIALSQLSRAVEGRTSHVPMLSDLRDSGSLEQDADQVWFIYRDELYDPETDAKGIAEIHVAKNRNGPTGVIPLRFFNHTTKFADLERYRVPAGFEAEHYAHASDD